MKKKVLGIYGSPRKKGNTDQILDNVLEGARSAGAEIETVYVRDLNMSGCIECGGCDKTGKCVVEDDMQSVYPMFERAGIVFLSSPIFFYDVTAQAKALIDRSQAMWAKRLLTKTPEQRKRYDSGIGYLIAVGATRGKNLFVAAKLTAKYFYDALDMDYGGELLFWELEKRTDARKKPEILQQSFDFGINAVKKEA
jgi:multimeric flavodoxin WrbA